MAYPQPDLAGQADAESGTFALSMDGTGMTARTGWVCKQAEPYEQLRQRETLLTACKGVGHEDDMMESDMRPRKRGGLQRWSEAPNGTGLSVDLAYPPLSS